MHAQMEEFSDQKFFFWNKWRREKKEELPKPVAVKTDRMVDILSVL